jgi:MSHA biogenesis protein MshM
VDPFALTPDTAAYVPRAATERALGELVAAVQGAVTAVAVVGGPGVGKTLLLHLLAERLGPGIRSVYLPNPRLEPAEVCTWVVRRLGAPAGEPTLPVLRAWIAHLREQEQACLLLVDDADAMPEATARWLGAFAAESRGGLRLALAALAGGSAERVLRVLGEVRRVDPGTALSPDETREYVAWRLDRAGLAPHLRARVDAPALAELHRVARGNPRRLHLAVEALLRKGAAVVVEDEIAPRGLARELSRTPAAPPPPSPAREPASPIAAPAPAVRAAPPPWRPRLAALAAAALATAFVATLLAPDETGKSPTAGAERADGTVPGARTEPGATPAPALAAAADPSPGTLPVNVNAVPWARIEVDGIEVGETPLAGVPLRPGPHTFRAELPDGRVVERRVVIDDAHRHVAFE